MQWQWPGTVCNVCCVIYDVLTPASPSPIPGHQTITTTHNSAVVVVTMPQHHTETLHTLAIVHTAYNNHALRHESEGFICFGTFQSAAAETPDAPYSVTEEKLQECRHGDNDEDCFLLLLVPVFREGGRGGETGETQSSQGSYI